MRKEASRTGKGEVRDFANNTHAQRLSYDVIGESVLIGVAKEQSAAMEKCKIR